MSVHRLAPAIFLAVAAVLAVAASGALNLQEGKGLRQLGERERNARAAQEVLSRWPKESRLAAVQMLESYGAPDEVGEGAMTWRRRGDWLWTTVRRDKDVARDRALVQQAVRYVTPVVVQNDLRRMGAGVEYEPIGGSLVASSDGEQTNTLALNLAVQMIEGKLSAEQARESYRRTLELAASGKSSEAMRRLLFKPSQSGRDPARRPGEILRFP